MELRNELVLFDPRAFVSTMPYSFTAIIIHNEDVKTPHGGI